MQSLLTSYFRKKVSDTYNETPFRVLPKEVETKIYGSLVDYVHKQITAGLISTVFCASVILIGLFDTADKVVLFFWYTTLISLTVIRFILAHVYQAQKLTDHDKQLWGISFVFFAGPLAGICWGFVGTLLLPDKVGFRNKYSLSWSWLALPQAQCRYFPVFCAPSLSSWYLPSSLLQFT